MSTTWTPPSRIEELYSKTNGNQWASINSPKAGAREEQPLPEGSAPVQLYSLATPNGWKVGILFEELGIDYDAFVINIGKGEQFTSGFVSVNPNSKIPCVIDKDGPGGAPISLFESGSIVQYFAEKYQRFIPSDPRLRAQTFNWVYWQMGGQGPMTGQFGHFFSYAPDDQVEARDYGASRYGMEVQRMCSVLDQHLKDKTYLVGEEYTIADIICFPWYKCVLTGYKHKETGRTAAEFLDVQQYKNVNAWYERILCRPAVQRGITVCNFNGVAKPWLEEGK